MTSTKVSRVIRAPRKAIYGALTNAEALVRWRVPDSMTAQIHEFDARAGGRYRMSLTYTAPQGTPGNSTGDTDRFEGRFVELIPYETIVETIVFEAVDAKFAGQMTQTTTLAEVEGGTLVTILHEDLPSAVRPKDNELGTSMSLRKLAELVE
jgi:uncharacterized protein YndB with AHSA1/START domain